jgi:hypothetical protein
VLCHGGPIAEPEDAEYVLANTTGVAGFFGASSIERFATENGIEAQARRFRDMRLPAAPKARRTSAPAAPKARAGATRTSTLAAPKPKAKAGSRKAAK